MVQDIFSLKLILFSVFILMKQGGRKACLQEEGAINRTKDKNESFLLFFCMLVVFVCFWFCLSGIQHILRSVKIIISVCYVNITFHLEKTSWKNTVSCEASDSLAEQTILPHLPTKERIAPLLELLFSLLQVINIQEILVSSTGICQRMNHQGH